MMRRLLMITALCLAAASPVFGQEASGASLRGELPRIASPSTLKKPSPGYFFYVEAPGSRKYACDGSVEERDEFDRYPGSAQRAFTASRTRPTTAASRRHPQAIARGPAGSWARSYAEAQARDDAAASVRDAMRCGQLPLGRWFWVERAFCDMPMARGRLRRRGGDLEPRHSRHGGATHGAGATGPTGSCRRAAGTW